MVQCIINLGPHFCVCKYRAFNHSLIGGEAWGGRVAQALRGNEATCTCMVSKLERASALDNMLLQVHPGCTIIKLIINYSHA